MPDGALLIEIVAAPLNCLLKLLAVERSNVAEPPVPKSLYVSLNVVGATCPETPNIEPSNNKLDSTIPFDNALS